MAVSSGLIGLLCSRIVPPPELSSVIVWGCSVWFDTVITTGPAPSLFGEIVTFSSVITPVSCTGVGGRGSFSKSSSPQPANTSMAAHIAPIAPARIRRVILVRSIPRAGTLTEPH